jgi:hypothetical protein
MILYHKISDAIIELSLQAGSTVYKFRDTQQTVIMPLKFKWLVFVME